MKAHLVVAALLSLWSVPALADVTPPEEEACMSAAKGQTCTLGFSSSSNQGAKGTCQDSTCGHIDYQHWDGGHPGSVQYACLKCLTPDGGLPVLVDGGSPVAEDKSTGGCSSLSTSSTAKEFGAIAIAGSFSLLFLLRRRRS
jgi:hypothetical protein